MSRHKQTMERAPLKQTLSLLGRGFIFQFDHGNISRFNHLWAYFQLFASTTINLLQKFSKLAGDACGVAIQERSIASMEITSVINAFSV